MPRRDGDMKNDAPTHVPAARPTERHWGAEGYWVESRQPLASLLFITPLLVTYELGVLILGPDAARNGADAWLRILLRWIGFGQYFLLPILTVCILLGWHYTTRRPWKISRGLLWGMTGECVLLAILLRFLSGALGILLQMASRPGTLDLGHALRATLGNAIGYLGAGIYEELLFRLILLSSVLWVLARFRLGPQARAAIAVVTTSLLFAAAHYVGPYGDALEVYSFVFRFLAGVFFSLFFLYRGFGIAAGAHAGYDILVGLFIASA